MGHRDRRRNNIQVKFLWQPSVRWVRGFLILLNAENVNFLVHSPICFWTSCVDGRATSPSVSTLQG